MKQLTLKTKMLIYAGACMALVFYLMYLFWSREWIPYNEESQRLESVLNNKKTELSKIMTQNQRKGELQREIKQASEDFIRLKEMFPDQDFIPKRLQDLSRASRRSSVVPVLFEPLNAMEKEFYMENNYAIKVESGYHGLGAFFQEIANFTYPTAITNVHIMQNASVKRVKNVSQIDDIINTIDTKFQLKTFTSK
ncbi:type 4a pilus biogenesis protein PilO [Fibrobacterota bacterium]